MNDVYPISVESEGGWSFDITVAGKTVLLERESGGGGWQLSCDGAVRWICLARVDGITALGKALKIIREEGL